MSGLGAPNESIESKIKTIYPTSQFFYQVPENISEMVQEYDFWVFDDMANYFAKTAHHKNCLMAYLTQNAYEPGVDGVTRLCITTKLCRPNLFQ